VPYCQKYTPTFGYFAHWVGNTCDKKTTKQIQMHTQLVELNREKEFHNWVYFPFTLLLHCNNCNNVTSEFVLLLMMLRLKDAF